MVPITAYHACYTAFLFTQERSNAVTPDEEGEPPTSKDDGVKGVSGLGAKYTGRGLSVNARSLINKSWNRRTKSRYECFVNKWRGFCTKAGRPWEITKVEHCANFLAELRASGLGYSSINTARSALSAAVCLEEGGSLGSHPLIVRIMKGVFKEAPSRPRYSETWDPNIVLEYVSKRKIVDLCLRDLSHNLATMLLLCSGQRCQTLAQLSADNVRIDENQCVFTITGILKTTRPGHSKNTLVLKPFKENKDICVVEHIREYMSRVDRIRESTTGSKTFFVSFKPPHRAVGPST